MNEDRFIKYDNDELIGAALALKASTLKTKWDKEYGGRISDETRRKLRKKRKKKKRK